MEKENIPLVTDEQMFDQLDSRFNGHYRDGKYVGMEWMRKQYESARLSDKKRISDLEEQNKKLREGLDDMERGRDYLMQVRSDEITVEDALEAFGFGRNGMLTNTEKKS